MEETTVRRARGDTTSRCIKYNLKMKRTSYDVVGTNGCFPQRSSPKDATLLSKSNLIEAWPSQSCQPICAFSKLHNHRGASSVAHRLVSESKPVLYSRDTIHVMGSGKAYGPGIRCVVTHKQSGQWQQYFQQLVTAAQPRIKLP